MADNSEAGSDAQITFKVKSSSEKNHIITMPETATVLDLKTKLAGDDFEGVPAERQRLIYSGRVLKNDDALSVYKIKNHNTIHMVKSAASNPAPPKAGTSSTPTPQAVPSMAAGTSANNPLAGLTGARYAGHANLPSRDLFGADGGMGAPPSEDQMAEMLSNPMIAQTMNEALSNPSFVDHMIQSNPMLASMPNAREMLQSPHFRNMMTNPEAIRMATRMRRAMGGGGPAAFPAPGVTDNTPAGAAGTDSNAAAAANPFGFPDMFGGQAPGAGAGANPFAGLFGGMVPPGFPTTGAAAAAGTPASPGQAAAPSANRDGEAGNTAEQPFNPFAALFNPPAQGGQAPGAANPFGMPAITPEAMRQAMAMFGAGGAGGTGGLGGLGGMGSPSAAAPQDTRPPEERYAEQLRQLNDMGFFDFEQNVAALRRSGGSVQGAIEHLLGGV
ncbi:hypothetical protein B0H63DRAFT_443910 [Podospora didyma]|uniref:Deubiquitination-protection protein dph1 n=1 Tax=Podospora didyma TaxID=330526 RepID=A0AAE0P659_9PEZI|nr:hypothetical protein B0H63DRAFT_443910 [Podospora didyma]